MAEFHVLNLYHDAFLSDTSHLGALETGAYTTLLLASWRTEDGGLPNDDVRLARMARCTPKEWRQVKRSVMAFWTMCQDGKWRQKRLEIEREAARSKSKSASRAAKERWRQENEAKQEAAEKQQVESSSEEPLTNKPAQLRGAPKLLKNKETSNADAMRTHMRNACGSDATTSTSKSSYEEEVDKPSPEPAREDEPDDWPAENQDGGAVLTRQPSDHRSGGQRYAGDVLDRFLVKTGPVEKRKKLQSRADQDMVRHLTSHAGMDTAKAWAVVMAARDEDDPAHTDAARLCERASRQHKLGWFAEETV